MRNMDPHETVKGRSRAGGMVGMFLGPVLATRQRNRAPTCRAPLY